MRKPDIVLLPLSESPGGTNVRPVTRALGFGLAVCVGVRLADQLIEPAIPMLAVLLFIAAVLALILRRG